MNYYSILSPRCLFMSPHAQRTATVGFLVDSVADGYFSAKFGDNPPAVYRIGAQGFYDLVFAGPLNDPTAYESGRLGFDVGSRVRLRKNFRNIVGASAVRFFVFVHICT